MDKAGRLSWMPQRTRVLGVLAACALLATGWSALDTGADAVTAGGATLAATDAPDGLVVTSLETGGPSAAAGLRVGDVIDRVDGLEAPTPAMLADAEAQDVAVLHIAARGDAGPRTLLLRRAEEGQGEDPDRRGR